MHTRQIAGSFTDEVKGKYILYWMQAAQRDTANPALDRAIAEANRYRLPLIVIFVIDPTLPETNLRHFRFMFEGLTELSQSLRQKGIPLMFVTGKADEGLPTLSDCALVVCDSGYLYWQKELRQRLYNGLDPRGIPYLEIETEPVVPVAQTSPKEEYAAATLRPKILRVLAQNLIPGVENQPQFQHAAHIFTVGIARDLPARPGTEFNSSQELEQWVQSYCPIPQTALPVDTYRGGRTQALARLDEFMRDHLINYATAHGDPAAGCQSELSPYLHFGQISALEVCRKLLEWGNLRPEELPELIRHQKELSGLLSGIAAYAEELIVRRELSMNFCNYNPHYDSYEAIPAWARETLEKHISDPRPYEYSLDRLENADTDDPYWNAAQTEMLKCGKMHNYMRMYWGKKVIEWTPDPEDAFYSLIYLNNRYELDGRDANAYAGIAWCFGKHDRPWQTRPVFGSVRYMNSAGLLRKFEMQKYLNRIGGLE